MRRIITWLSATVVAVALLIGYQLAFAGSGAADGGESNRPGGDTSVHEDKPGESK
jgi:hypothetical protein